MVLFSACMASGSAGTWSIIRVLKCLMIQMMSNKLPQILREYRCRINTGVKFCCAVFCHRILAFSLGQ